MDSELKKKILKQMDILQRQYENALRSKLMKMAGKQGREAVEYQLNEVKELIEEINNA